VDKAPEEGIAAELSLLSSPGALGRTAELSGSGVGEDGSYLPIKSLALKVLEGNGKRLEFSAENCSAFGPEREGEKFSDGLMLGSCAVLGGWSGVIVFGTVGQL
jgi:hypothetical protein